MFCTGSTQARPASGGRQCSSVMAVPVHGTLIVGCETFAPQRLPKSDDRLSNCSQFQRLSHRHKSAAEADELSHCVRVQPCGLATVSNDDRHLQTSQSKEPPHHVPGSLLFALTPSPLVCTHATVRSDHGPFPGYPSSGPKEADLIPLNFTNHFCHLPYITRSDPLMA